ncbi:hypothetical protein L1987_22381 [Smallanthus sonchifolius]|uniref:Uncharacterized protein n=1 Tax=Smallanthus sonchifolius TaxID=185202 RepID=A0ACB9IEP1_9ASTR|nr:hypothetical protein L1987_22381 [Smallanthus sonchifolius]
MSNLVFTLDDSTASSNTNSGIRAKGFKGSDKGKTSCKDTHGGIRVETHTSGEDKDRDLILQGSGRLGVSGGNPSAKEILERANNHLQHGNSLRTLQNSP